MPRSIGLGTWEVATEWHPAMSVGPNLVDSLMTWRMVYQTHKRNLFRVFWSPGHQPRHLPQPC